MHTHRSAHTHHEHTPGAVAAIYVAAPGEQLGFSALLKGLT